MTVERTAYLEKISPFIDTDLVKVLTGMRRTGKSVLLAQIKGLIISRAVKEENCLYYNFENLIYAPLCNASALHTEIREKKQGLSGKIYLFFDEIQEVRDWEKCINSLRTDADFDIYITGSNAKLLSGELATYLAGRYIEFTVYPFSFKEYCPLYKNHKPNIGNEELFLEYIKSGGMPYLKHIHFAAAPSKQYLKDLYNSVVLKDIVKRNAIRDIDLLERILLYLCAQTGNTFSARSISKYFKNEGRTASLETILNYIKASENAYLLYRIKRQDLLGKRILTVQEKYYIADHGLRSALLGKTEAGPIPSDINLIFENIVCLELLRRGYSIYIGKLGDAEIDFVATKNGQKLYIQVAYLLANAECIAREFTPLLAIKDNYPKYVISFDSFDMGRDGILHINIRDFLSKEIW